MADITLTVQRILPAGTVVTHLGSLSTSNTYKARNDGKVFIRLVNGSGGAIVATIATPGIIGGNAVADRDVSVAAGTEENIGPFPPSVYNDSNGDINVTLDVITSATLAALHLG